MSKNQKSTTAALEKVEAKSKIYENISTKLDPHYNDCIAAIKIITQFITDRKLIIYGGTAMDYALRLHGDQIYPDEVLTVPDLDFYSPDSVKDAYDLADILYAAGYSESRAFGATYVTTMRVDIADNHFLADISYIPRNVFDKLPWIEYNGVRIIDPIFQKVDIHSSLSFPFDNPPREVIFARWRKDISRYNLLHKYYPTPTIAGKFIKPTPITFAYSADMIMSGIAAYGVIYSAYRELIKSLSKVATVVAPEVTPVEFTVDSKNMLVTCDSYDDTLQLIHADIGALIKSLNIADVKFHTAYINLITKHIKGKITGKSKSSDKIDVMVIATTDSYIGINQVEFGKLQFTTVGIQFVLMQLLVMAHLATNNNHKHTYYAYYESVLAMINHVEDLFAATPDVPDKLKLMMKSPFFPSIDIYGNDNLSPSYKLGYNRDLAAIGEEAEIVKTPLGYHPARKHPQPVFNYEESVYFTKDGREVEMKK